MAVANAVEALEQAVVGDQERVARAHALSLGHDCVVLQVGENRHVERGQLPDRLPDSCCPLDEQLVPVLVVEPTPLGEQLGAAGEGRHVGDGVGTVVGVHLLPSLAAGRIETSKGLGKPAPAASVCSPAVIALSSGTGPDCGICPVPSQHGCQAGAGTGLTPVLVPKFTCPLALR
jgi:hypothetical protein